MWKWIFAIYVSTSILAFVLVMGMSLLVIINFQRDYPDLKMKKAHPIGQIISALRVILISIIPIVNAIIVLGIALRGDQVYEEVMTKTVNKAKQHNTDS